MKADVCVCVCVECSVGSCVMERNVSICLNIMEQLVWLIG